MLPSTAYTTVIKGGCADGSLMPSTVLDAGLDHIGVDVVGQAVAITRQAIAARTPRHGGQRATPTRSDVREPEAVDGLLSLGGRLLLVLPFNLFGIVARPHEALFSAARIFRRGGWPGAEVQMADGTHDQGDHFISSVHNSGTPARWLREAGFVSTESPYGEIGRASLGTRTAIDGVGTMTARGTGMAEPAG